MHPQLESTPSSTTRGILIVGGIIAAVVLFVAIPMIQAISTGLKNPNEIHEVSFVIPPPEVLDLQPPAPPETEEESEELEMEKEPPRLSLDQLEMALNPSMGDVGSGLNVDLSIDSKSLGTDDLIFEIDDVEEIPRAIRRIQPNYPAVLKRKNVEGLVSLIFVIDTNGSVLSPTIERSTHVEFEEPALDAIRRWKFTPGKRGGEAVKVRVRLPLQFVP
ncbi:MAG: energy transducer TonB [Puniceicoccaceae bacterium]